MLIVPVIMAITFWLGLVPPKIDVATITPLMEPNEPTPTGDEIVSYETVREPEMALTFKEKSILMKVIKLTIRKQSTFLINFFTFSSGFITIYDSIGLSLLLRVFD